MNILLINHYAGSPQHGMEFRPYYLAREWVRLGHQVTIAAANFSHVRAKQPEGLGADPHDETLDGIHYRWYPTPPYAGNGLGRVRNIAAFFRQVWADAPRLAHGIQPQAVIASSTYPMDIWLAQRIARIARAQWVYEVHDLWPLSLIELAGMHPWHPFALLCQIAENAAYRRADAVVSMLPKVQGHMAAHGLDLRKLHIIPNGVALDDWQGAPEPLRADVAQAIAELRKQGQQLLGYAGSQGRPNALEVLLQVAKALEAERIAFVLVGDGHEHTALKAQAQQLALHNVLFFSPIPKAQVRSFLHAIDVAYIGWQAQPIYRFGIAPNKLMDYMMAGKPVVHAVDAGNDPVRDAGCGESVAPDDVPAIAAAIRKLLALSDADRAAMGARGKAFVEAHHSYAVLAQRFIHALQRPQAEMTHG